MIEVDDAFAQEVLDDAHAVAYPRYPGTGGDEKAIRWVEEKLAAAGLEVEKHEFTYDLRPAFRALRAVLVAAGLLLGASGLWAARSPAGAAAVLAVGLLAGGIVLGWAPGREELYRREGPTRTANVAGWRRARGTPRTTVILLAHHDSKSQNLTLPWRAGMSILSILSALALIVLLGLALLLGAPPGPPWLTPAAGLVGAAALFVLSTLHNGNLSPGGVDNAGSLAIVLNLARVLPQTGPDDVEWVFLSPGAEEDHMIGAMRWLDAHKGDLAGRPVWSLNFDGVGNPGRLVLIARFGFGTKASPTITPIAQRLAREQGERVRTIVTPPAMGVDAIPFVHRGYECLTFASGSLGPATTAVHSRHDRAELLDRETLRRGARLGAAVALELASRRPDG